MYSNKTNANVNTPLLPVVAENNTGDTEIVVWSRKETTRRFVKLAIPFTASRLTDIISEIISGKFFAILGPEYLAANALMLTMRRLVTGFDLGSLYSVGSLIGREVNDEEIGELARRGILFGLLLSVPASALIFYSKPFLILLGQDSQVSGIVEDFYRGAILSIPGIFLSGAIAQFTVGIKRPNISLVINTASNTLALGIGSALTFGLCGLPKLKAKGLGYGYSIAYAVSITGAGIYFLTNKAFSKYKLASGSFISFRRLGEVIKVGLPFGTQIASDYLMLSIISIITGLLGNDQLTAARIAEMIYIPLLVLSMRAPQANSRLTGDAIKMHCKKLIKRLTYTNITTLEAINALYTFLVCMLSKEVMGLLIDVGDPANQQIVTFTENLFWLYPMGLSAEIIRYGIGGSLRAFKDTKIAMWNSLIILDLIGLPTIYLAYTYGIDLETLYIIRDCALAIAATSISVKWAKKINNYFSTNNNDSSTPGSFERAKNQVSSCFYSFFGKKQASENANKRFPAPPSGCINKTENLP